MQELSFRVSPDEKHRYSQPRLPKRQRLAAATGRPQSANGPVRVISAYVLAPLLDLIGVCVQPLGQLHHSSARSDPGKYHWTQGCGSIRSSRHAIASVEAEREILFLRRAPTTGSSCSNGAVDQRQCLGGSTPVPLNQPGALQIKHRLCPTLSVGANLAKRAREDFQ